MANINVLLPDGSEETYYNVETVSYDSASEVGGTEVFVSEHLIRAQAQSDWNQVDESQPDFIKNKPFGEVNADIALIDGSYKWVYNGGAWDMEAPIPITSDIHLEEGKTYTVTWNDTEYTCECFMYAGLAGAVGNGAALGGDNTGEPFIIVEDAAGLLSGTPMFIFIVIENPDPTVTTEVTYDIKLTYSGTVVNHLDNKYLSFMDYVEPKEIDILPVARHTNFSFNSMFNLYTDSDNLYYNFSIGETYIVSWDGIEYECVAQNANGVMSGAIALGNASVLDQSGDLGLSGNGEPFIIGYVNGMIMYISLTDTEDGGFHDVGISKIIEGHHVIKDEYAPKSDWNNIKNKPFGTIPSGTVIFDDMVNCNIEDYGGRIAIIQKLDIGIFTYTVEFDGNSYQIVGEETNDGIRLSHDLFAIQNLDNMCFVISTFGEHTLKITLAEDAVTKIDSKYLPLPEVTASDAGKFLRVDSYGAWVAEAIPSAEGASF